jgi:Asp-tRNA(Asn)/Glu-tRNA(Gln) amidotransferase A subunit family amidase
MKPTFGAISPEGSNKSYSPDFDTPGFFTRSVGDLQLVANVFALVDDKPPNDVPLAEASVALIKTPMWRRAGPGAIVAMEKAAAILQTSSVRVE